MTHLEEDNIYLGNFILQSVISVRGLRRYGRVEEDFLPPRRKQSEDVLKGNLSLIKNYENVRLIIIWTH